MAAPIDAGGYVYPSPVGDLGETDCRGITLRDWFAGMAMSGLVTGTGSDKDTMHPKTALELARAAYHIADLMVRQSREAVVIAHSDEPAAVR